MTVWGYLAWIIGALWFAIAVLMLAETAYEAVRFRMHPTPIVVQVVFDILWPVTVPMCAYFVWTEHRP